MDPKTRIKDLRKLIKKYNRLYFDKQESRISDYEYDMLLRELVELEETFINSFGEDNVSFWWSDEGDAYFITIWCDFTFDEFYEFDVNSKTRDNLDFLCLMGNSVTNVDTFLTLYSKTEGVIYASYNGADFTREALISQGANN